MRKINNYEELILEQTRLEIDLQNQKTVLKAEITSLKTRLEPFKNFVAFLRIFKPQGTENSSLLKSGISFGMDLLVSGKLSKANWLLRILSPLALKGITNKLINTKTS